MAMVAESLPCQMRTLHLHISNTEKAKVLSEVENQKRKADALFNLA